MICKAENPDIFKASATTHQRETAGLDLPLHHESKRSDR